MISIETVLKCEKMWMIDFLSTLLSIIMTIASIFKFMMLAIKIERENAGRRTRQMTIQKVGYWDLTNMDIVSTESVVFYSRLLSLCSM